jgi:hypothetical protein
MPSQSTPSDASKEVCVKGKQRPVIDRKSSCHTVSVSRGENAMLWAKFTGDPVPERKWLFGKIMIEDGNGSVSIADKDHSSRLTLFNARKDDTGQYEFKAGLTDVDRFKNVGSFTITNFYFAPLCFERTVYKLGHIYVYSI